MKYRAVIFDLFGTLVDDLRHPHRQEIKYRRWKSEAAVILGVPIEDFTRAWSEMVPLQSVGAIKGPFEPYKLISESLGSDVSEEQLKCVASIGLEYVRCSLSPREGVLETLARLRKAGIRTGLISNCLADTFNLWPSTPFSTLFDVAILSFEVGTAKPDPGIYGLARERLGVEPSKCLFVGDGGSGELTGATDAGMDAVLIRAPDDTENGDREDWRGTRISSVSEVLNLVE